MDKYPKVHSWTMNNPKSIDNFVSKSGVKHLKLKGNYQNLAAASAGTKSKR